MTKEELDIQKEIGNYFTESTGFGRDKIKNFIDIVNKALKQKGERIAELEQKLEQTEKDLADYQFNYPKIKELQKENEELKKQGDKWFVFETEAGNWGMDKATQHTVDRHNYFYGTKEECHKWGVEHKIKDYTGHKYCYDRLEDQLAKAKELIENIIRVTWGEGWSYSLDWKAQAEQFLKEIEK